MIDLNTSIQNLYSTFGKYTVENMQYCDCGCIDPDDAMKLHSKPLRELQESDIMPYIGRALYTWGEIDHYKHFLPRILELRSQPGRIALVDIDEISRTIEYADWKSWPLEEQQAILDYIKCDWRKLLNGKEHDIGITDFEDYGNFFSVGQLLAWWDLESSDALRKFVFFFYNHGNQILSGGLKINGEVHETEFLQFSENNLLLEQLEKTFFKIENDEAYAECISVVLQMLEQATEN